LGVAVITDEVTIEVVQADKQALSTQRNLVTTHRVDSKFDLAAAEF
jgi:hypothetical protein